MAVEHASEQTVIDAPRDACVAVVLDFDRYPTWAPDLKEVTVEDRDEEGRGRRVRFRAAAMGHSSTYVLQYDYRQFPDVLAWALVEGDLTRKLDGLYRFIPLDDGRTEVHYVLEAELVVPLPAFIKRRTELKIVHTALRDLKARVEEQLAQSGPA